MAGICTSPSPSPYLIEKIEDSPYPYTHTQSMRGFSVKTETGSGNTHGGGFICDLYLRCCQTFCLQNLQS